MNFMEQGHLGGYCIGGDDATFYPELWTWLVEEYGVESVIDVGCGEGQTFGIFGDLGCSWVGVEGVEQPPGRPIVQHDYTLGPLGGEDLNYVHLGSPEMDGRYELCWCCEFVEHVEESYLPNFLATFQCADLVLMTHAFPGQPGYHHVNLREPEYWKGVMAAIGYAYDDVLTIATRELARENTSPWNHFVRSGLAFRRYS